MYLDKAVKYALHTANPFTFPPPRSVRIIEVGAGGGRLTTAIKAAAAELELPLDLTALDDSYAAAQEFQQSHPGTPIVCGSMNQLPLVTGEADIVMCGFSLHFGDPKRVLGEVRRVLRPGGALVAFGEITNTGTDFSRMVYADPGLDFLLDRNPVTAEAAKGGKLQLNGEFRRTQRRRTFTREGFQFTREQLLDRVRHLAGLVDAPVTVRNRALAGAEKFVETRHPKDIDQEGRLRIKWQETVNVAWTKKSGPTSKSAIR